MKPTGFTPQRTSYKKQQKETLCDIQLSSPILLLFLILKVLEKRPPDILTTFQKDVHRVTSLGRPQDVNFKPLVQNATSPPYFQFYFTKYVPESLKS